MAKVLGFTDSYSDCDCCGKSGLKGTYVVLDDNGTVIHYGSTCVKRNLGLNITQVKSQINEAKLEIINDANIMHQSLGGLELRKQLAESEVFSDEYENIYDLLINMENHVKAIYNLDHFIPRVA